MHTITRTVTLSLDEATDFKKQKLDEFLSEYARVVNQFIDLYWTYDKLPGLTKAEHYKQIDSWFSAPIRQCAGNRAIDIIKLARDRSRKLTYQKYKRIYAKCAKTGKNHFGILDKKYSEWVKGKHIKFRGTKPVYDKLSAELACTVVQLQNPKHATSFDYWVNVTGVFPNRYCPKLPTNKHRQFNKYVEQGYTLASSARIRKTNNEKFLLDVFFKKEVEEPKQEQTNAIGIDLGVRKLFAISNGRTLGSDIRRLIDKLNNRKQGSKRWYRTLAELKNYIGRSVNQIGIEDYDLIVLEDLKKGHLIIKGGKTCKHTRKLLSYWNLKLVYKRVQNKCEENRVQLEFVDPAYTSQQCSNCGAIHRESRDKERYHCVECGYSDDADLNASKNILKRFLDREHTFPYNTKTKEMKSGN